MKIRAEVLFFKGNSASPEKVKNLLKIKKDVMEMKKKGTIYIDKPISQLELDSIVDFYHMEHPGNTLVNDAFPVPKVVYSKNKHDTKTLIKTYYQKYYNQKCDDVEMKKYDTKPFEAKEVVWFVKK